MAAFTGGQIAEKILEIQKQKPTPLGKGKGRFLILGRALASYFALAMVVVLDMVVLDVNCIRLVE
jgi:hypothetical protein